MTNKPADEAHALRKSAEDIVDSQIELTVTTTNFINDKFMLHELQVHKIELDMQNEELHRTIQMLQEHEEHLHDIIKNTPAGYFRIDLVGRFLEVNSAWLHIHGYDSPDEILGKHFSVTQVESEMKVALKHVEDLLSGLAIPTGVFTHVRKDGSIGFHTFSAHPVVHTGKVVGLEWFIVDRSTQMKVENEKKMLQQQFQQAQKMESLGVLAGGIAHDFNNILTIIMGYCYLVEMNYKTAEKHIPMIKLAAKRAAGLCSQMLTYAGKGQYILVPLNIVKLVDEMIMMLKTTISQNVVIQPNLPSNIPIIKGDDSQIRQLVMNLIINSVEAIGETQGKILVSLSSVEITTNQSNMDYLGNVVCPGCYVCLEVTDSGCGMDEETKRRIFEPFYTTKFSGRGLGMSAVLGIISAHNGVLQLSSQLGRGTTFKVYLPVQAPESAGGVIPTDPSESWKGSGTILLVEDEAQIKIITKLLLESLGFTVIDASNGKEAMDLYLNNSEKVRLVVTDLGMPVMDGYALVHELKKIAPKLPIIISSGFGDANILSKFAYEDIAGVISKPYSPDRLRETLKSILESATF
jgi:PAS domain S-box-containing protein